MLHKITFPLCLKLFKTKWWHIFDRITQKHRHIHKLVTKLKYFHHRINKRSKNNITRHKIHKLNKMCAVVIIKQQQKT